MTNNLRIILTGLFVFIGFMFLLPTVQYVMLDESEKALVRLADDEAEGLEKAERERRALLVEFFAALFAGHHGDERS